MTHRGEAIKLALRVVRGRKEGKAVCAIQKYLFDILVLGCHTEVQNKYKCKKTQKYRIHKMTQVL